MDKKAAFEFMESELDEIIKVCIINACNDDPDMYDEYGD